MAEHILPRATDEEALDHTVGTLEGMLSRIANRPAELEQQTERIRPLIVELLKFQRQSTVELVVGVCEEQVVEDFKAGWLQSRPILKRCIASIKELIR